MPAVLSGTRKADSKEMIIKLLCKIFKHSNWVYIENGEMHCTRCGKPLGYLGSCKRKIIKTKQWHHYQKIYKLSSIGTVKTVLPSKRNL